MKDLQVIHGDGYARLDPNDGHGYIAKVRLRPTMTKNVEELGRMARLFAAAPELLDVLRDILLDLSANAQLPARTVALAARERARQIIAKATGN